MTVNFISLRDILKRLVKLDKSIKLTKKQFLILILAVFLTGTIGLLTYVYINFGDEYAKNRSTTVMGQPKFIHPIAGEGNSKLLKPLSAAVLGKYVYITDSANGKLAIFTKRGSLVRSVDLLQGSDPYPLGITLDDRGRIYLSVEIHGFYHIMVVNAKGKFQYLFPENKAAFNISDQPVLNHPMGLFYHDGKIYVSDAGDHDVKVFSTDGKLVKKFGRAGNKEGQFMFPHGIAVDEAGNIYVADSNNSRVQVFDKDGKFKHLFKPSEKEPLVIPRGIAIDSLGRVHVVDLARQKVLVFTKKGKYLLSYGSGKNRQVLSYPNGIAIDQKAGLIYIADRQNNRIAVFSE